MNLIKTEWYFKSINNFFLMIINQNLVKIITLISSLKIEYEF
jgi:hypothetical protein